MKELSITNRSSTTQRSVITRLIHLILALLIVVQLTLSLVMTAPSGTKAGDQWFELHEKFGLAALAALLIFWVWSLLRNKEVKAVELFPYFSAARMAAVYADFKDVTKHALQLNIPDKSEQPFANAVHGLGIIIASVMAASGASGYFLKIGFMLGVHEVVSKLMWAYLIGHVFAAILHQLRGDAILSRMFFIRK